MPVTIACPKCTKQYRVGDAAVGKAVKCKQCGAAFKATPAAQASIPVAQSAGSQRLSDQELNQFGIEGNLEQQPDVFGAATPPQQIPGLGNFAGEDPGFGHQPVALVQEPGPQPNATDNANPYSAVLSNPAVRTKKSKTSAGKKTPQAEKIRGKFIKTEVEIQQWGIVYVFFGALGLIFGLLILLGGFAAGAALSGAEAEGVEVEEGAAMILGVGMAIVAIVVFVVAGFQLSAGLGMFFLNRYGQIAGAIVTVFGLLSSVANLFFACLNYEITFMTGGGWFNLILLLLWISVEITILWYLVGKPGWMIFSSDYRRYREQTPHITHTSYTAAIVIGIAILFIVVPILFLGFAGAMLSSGGAVQ